VCKKEPQAQRKGVKFEIEIDYVAHFFIQMNHHRQQQQFQKATVIHRAAALSEEARLALAMM
jgi:hypothetical protein